MIGPYRATLAGSALTSGSKLAKNPLNSGESLQSHIDGKMKELFMEVQVKEKEKKRREEKRREEKRREKKSIRREKEEKGEESFGCAVSAEPPPLPDMHAATTEVKHDIKWPSNRRRILIAECLNLSFGGDMRPSKKAFLTYLQHCFSLLFCLYISPLPGTQ